MIVRKDQTPSQAVAERAERLGPSQALPMSDMAGLTQFGAYVQTLQPGARSSERHWHEQEDEFLYMLAGEATVIENDGEHVLRAGDAAGWPAGVANGHQVVNRSAAPCSFLIMGTRPSHDVCHYPDSGRTLYTEGDTWRLLDAAGAVLRSGAM